MVGLDFVHSPPSHNKNPIQPSPHSPPPKKKKQKQTNKQKKKTQNKAKQKATKQTIP